LWNRMRIGFTLSFSQPCSGHSNLCGNLIAPGTGFTISFALHFGQFKRSPFASMRLRARLDSDLEVHAWAESTTRGFWRAGSYEWVAILWRP
jgi:hypothetical protein